MRLTNKWSALSLAILRFALPAQVVKLVDTLASGASARKGVEVQVLSWAPLPMPFRLESMQHGDGVACVQPKTWKDSLAKTYHRSPYCIHRESAA